MGRAGSQYFGHISGWGWLSLKLFWIHIFGWGIQWGGRGLFLESPGYVSRWGYLSPWIIAKWVRPVYCDLDMGGACTYDYPGTVHVVYGSIESLHDSLLTPICLELSSF